MSRALGHSTPERAWEAADLEDVTGCPACGGAECQTLYSGLHDQVFDIAGGTWTIMRCKSCSAAFLSPRPAQHALQRAYAGAYYTHEPMPCDASAATPHLSGHRLRSRNAYLNRRYGFALAPASTAGLLLAGCNPRFRAAHARQVRHLRLPHPGARLLDVGCGSGGFVALALALGWSARGIDIDRSAVDAGLAARLPLTVRTIEEEATKSPGAFEAVTMEHVLEHVPDPLAFLRAARTLLRPGGALWIATPNLSSSGHRRFGSSWKNLDPPRHLVMFTGEILDRLLRAAGFTSVTTRRSASGTIATYAQSTLIAEGCSPLGPSAIPRSAALRGRLAGVRALLQPASADELVRVARIDR